MVAGVVSSALRWLCFPWVVVFLGLFLSTSLPVNCFLCTVCPPWLTIAASFLEWHLRSAYLVARFKLLQKMIHNIGVGPIIK